MWNYPNLDPVALDFGVIVIHWYAVSYLVGIGSVSYTHLTLPTKRIV